MPRACGQTGLALRSSSVPVEWTGSSPELLIPLDRGGTEPLRRPAGALVPRRRAQRPAATRRAAALDARAGQHPRRLPRAGRAVLRPAPRRGVPRGPARVGDQGRRDGHAGRARRDRLRPGRASLGIDFVPAVPDLAAFPREDWAWAVREAPGRRLTDELGYPGPAGRRGCASVLASYLDRVRGTAADPERIVVCSGFSQGLTLALTALAERGVRRVAFEDPGYDETGRISAAAAGVEAGARAGGRGGRPGDGPGCDRGGRRRAHAGPPVADRCRALTAAPARPGGLGRDARRLGGGGRLRRRVPLRPCPGRRRAGACPRTHLPDRYRQQVPGSGRADGLAGLPRRPGRRRSRSRRCGPTAARRCSTSWRWPRSWSPDASTGTCGGCARPTSPDATPWSRAWPSTPRTSGSPGWPRASTPSRTSRRIATRTVVAAAATRSVGLYGMSPQRSTRATDPPQLVLGFGNLGERAIREGIARVADLLRRLMATRLSAQSGTARHRPSRRPTVAAWETSSGCRAAAASP